MLDPSLSPEFARFKAENTSTGTQPIHQGSGPQQVLAGSNGRQYNYDVKAGRYVHISLPGVSDSSGVAELLHGDGKNEPREPSREDIIEWLRSQSSLNSLGRHRWLLSKRVGDTGSWVLKKAEFLHWRDDSTRLLWMQGILGCGKSTLASIIIDHLEKQPPEGAASTACIHAHFSNGEERQRFSFADIFLSLSLQLMQQQKNESVGIDDLKKKYNSRRYGKVFHTSNDYLDVFNAQAAAFEKVFLIFDALDNCGDSAEEKTQKLVHVAIIRQLPPNIKVLATSKSARPSLWKTGGCKELIVKADETDLKAYVQDRIKNHDRMQHIIGEDTDANYQTTVVNKVVQATSDMFLLAELHMDKLGEQWTLGDFKLAVEKLHDTVSKAFEDSVQRIRDLERGPEPKKYELAQHVLTWVIHAATPMTIEDLRHSFALRYSSQGILDLDFRPSESDLMSCGGLVVKDPHTGRLHLVHPSVQDHVLSHGIVSQDADKVLASTCLSYLLLEEFAVNENTVEAVQARLKRYPFLEYAAMNWPTHLRRAANLAKLSTDVDPDGLHSLAMEFLRSKPKATSSFQVIKDTDIAFSTITGINGLHVTTYFNLPTLVKLLIADDSRLVNKPCSDGQTGLHWAAKKHDGQSSVLQLLLEKSADPNLQDSSGETPLHKAVMAEHNTNVPLTESENIVRQLVKAGAQAILRNKEGFTPLKWTTQYGPPSIAEILVMSLKSADIDTPDEQGWTPLWDAMRYGQLELTRLLLERSANPDRLCPDGWTPLIWAAQGGHQDAVRLLFQHGANINRLSNKMGYSALRWALSHKHAHVAQQLIRYGADVETKASDGSTALIGAVKNNDRGMVWVLAQAGANLDVQDECGASALHYATMAGNKLIIWLLLMRGANLSVRDKQGLSTLDWAVQRNDFPVLWLLAESPDGHQLMGETAPTSGLSLLHRAADLGHEEIVRFLLSRGGPAGLSPDQKDGKGLTALHHAVAAGREGVVRLLASQGAQLDIKDNGGMTPLAFATYRRDIATMRVLLDHGASCDVQDDNGWTALHYGAKAGFAEGLILLLERSRDPDIQDKSMGFTALHHAVRNGDAKVVVLFRRRVKHNGTEKEKDTKGEEGQEPSGQEESHAQIGGRGVDVDVQDAEGRTALMLAVSQGDEQMTYYLAHKQGARVDLKDKNGQTARDHARGQRSVLRWLEQ